MPGPSTNATGLQTRLHHLTPPASNYSLCVGQQPQSTSNVLRMLHTQISLGRQAGNIAAAMHAVDILHDDTGIKQALPTPCQILNYIWQVVAGSTVQKHQLQTLTAAALKDVPSGPGGERHSIKRDCRSHRPEPRLTANKYPDGTPNAV
jgi:hypothetical protein